MKNVLNLVRLLFVSFCLVGSYLYWQTHPDFHGTHTVTIFLVGATIAVLGLLIDFSLKSYSLSLIGSVTAGLALGAILTYLITQLPVFDMLTTNLKQPIVFALYTTFMYLGVIAILRSNNNFSMLIPFVRMSPQGPDLPKVVIDGSILVDGRIATLCQSRFMSATFLVPKFVLETLQKLITSEDPQKQIKGRKGLEVLNKLKNMQYIDLRIKDSDTDEDAQADSKIIYLAQLHKAKIMTTDYSLAKLAEFNGIEWLNLNALVKALNPEIIVGQYLDVDLVKTGKEPHQGVGYLSDGSMVVVNESAELIGKTVASEVISILPSAGGKMIFARLHNGASEATA